LVTGLLIVFGIITGGLTIFASIYACCKCVDKYRERPYQRITETIEIQNRQGNQPENHNDDEQNDDDDIQNPAVNDNLENIAELPADQPAAEVENAVLVENENIRRVRQPRRQQNPYPEPAVAVRQLRRLRDLPRVDYSQMSRRRR